MKRVLSILMVVVMAASAFGIKPPNVKTVKNLVKTNTAALVAAKAFQASKQQVKTINAQQQHNSYLTSTKLGLKDMHLKAKTHTKRLKGNNLKLDIPQSNVKKLDTKKLKLRLLNKKRDNVGVGQGSGGERESPKDSTTLSQTAISLILNGDYAPDTLVQEFIFEKYLKEMIDAGKYEEALSTFSKDPFSSFAFKDAILSLMLCDAALGANDVERFNYYLQNARRCDEEMADEYFNLFWDWNYETALAHPEDSDLTNWLVEENLYPAAMAYLLCNDIMDKYFIIDISKNKWKWVDISAYTPEQLEIIKRTIEIGMHGLEVDDERTDAEVKMDLILTITLLMTVDPTEIENAGRYVDNISRMIEDKRNRDLDDIFVRHLIVKAYIKGHGMDRPGEAFKVLNKEAKKVKGMDIDTQSELMFWDYLRASGEASGRRKEMRKYDSLILQLQNKMETEKMMDAEPTIDKLLY